MTATVRNTRHGHKPVAVLVGAPGAGKSTVGRVLAGVLDLPFRDTDRDIEQAAGKAVSDIFFDDGEDQFRRLETAAVAAALAEHEGILALGGGAILDPGTRELLTDHRVIWLKVDVPAAAKRVGLARDRPLLSMNPRAHLREMLASRAPLYAEVATDIVDASQPSVASIVERLRRMLAPVGR